MNVDPSALCLLSRLISTRVEDEIKQPIIVSTAVKKNVNSTDDFLLFEYKNIFPCILFIGKILISV
jgi:hypothetical protein